jgi:Sulfatase
VLWSFAIAKPLFDVLADSPDFFVARGNTGGDIVIFSLALVLLPPTGLVLLEALAAPLPPLRRGLHLLFVAGLAGAFALQLFDDVLGGSAVPLLLGAAAGVACAFAYERVRAVPTILTVLGPAPLVFLLLFLLGSPVSKLVLPEGDAAAADVQVRSDTPVVLVVFDEFDPNMLMDAAGRIDRTRYPNFAALADGATWYRNATTVSNQTTLAVPALLSARRPQPDLLPIAADFPNTVFTLVGSSHALDVTETATEVCPERLCGAREREPAGKRLRSLTKDLGIVSLHLLAPEGLDHRLPDVDRTFGDFAGGGRDQAAQTQPDVPLSALRNRPTQLDTLVGAIGSEGDDPGLYFVHTALPHVPWQYLPTGQQYINAGPDTPGLDGESWSTDSFPPRLGLQRHLLQVGYVDRFVGRLTAKLRSTGLYDRALVILTADHGVSYRRGQPRRAPNLENASDIAGVPLLIKYPQERDGHVVDSMARTIDIVPTIAHELGVDLPWEADGRPLSAGGPAGGQVAVAVGDTGKNLTLAFDDYVRRREAGLRRMVRLFGSDDRGARLYANGPNWDLLGRSVARLPSAPSPGARAELDSAQQLDDFSPDGRVVPSFVSGRIEGGLGPGVSLAVAVNGRIGAVTESFTNEGELRLAGIVPVSAFRAGSNSLAIYAVQGTGAQRRLAPLETARPTGYRLVGDAIEGGGQTYPVEEGNLQGFVDRPALDDQGALLAGWAVDPDGPVAAERILVFFRGRLVAQGRPSQARPDIVDNFNSDAVLKSGFELRAAAPGAELDDLRVFALSENGASELPRFNR